MMKQHWIFYSTISRVVSCRSRVPGHFVRDSHAKLAQNNGGIRHFQSSSRQFVERKLDPLAFRVPKSETSGYIGLGGYFQLVIPVSTFCLGVWQVYRWFWKLDLIEAMEKKTSETLPFSSVNLDKIDEYEYKTVTLKGKFIPGNEGLLGPRSLKSDNESGGGLISQGQSQSGYHILTPFRVADQDITVVVNRGWIPTRDIDKYQIDPKSNKEIEIAGVLRKGEKRAPFMSKTQPGSKLWLYRDLSSMAEKLGTSEIFIDLSLIYGSENNTKTSLQEKGVLPVPGQTRVTLRNEHVSYFLTWFSLSGITGYLWFRQFKQRLPLK